MKVAVLINSQAGYANKLLIESAIRAALFRCDLSFHLPESVAEMQKTVLLEAMQGIDSLIICGGDGTLNAAIQPLMLHRQTIDRLPRICLIPVGTANDLARELNISTRIGEAAHAILNGSTREIDVLEIESGGRKAYMLTNGGLGVPAETARIANNFRQWVRKTANCPYTKFYYRPFFKVGQHAIQMAGSKIYEILLAGTITRWDTKHWDVELSFPNHAPIMTHAPFIMISNQPSLGGKFLAAPLTVNSDGQFNVLLLQSEKLTGQMNSLRKIRQGQIPSMRECPAYETDVVRIRSRGNSKPLTFFGDGEILHTDVKELEVRCIHKGLTIVTGVAG